MIQPNELRIGSIVFAYPFRIIRVSEINANGVLNQGDETEEPFIFEDLEGIPLTPEILEKAGLVKHGAIWIHPETMLLEIYNRAKLDGNYHFIGGRMQPDYFLATTKQLKFVHELQNAFALTGTELEIKL